MVQRTQIRRNCSLTTRGNSNQGSLGNRLFKKKFLVRLMHRSNHRRALHIEQIAEVEIPREINPYPTRTTPFVGGTIHGIKKCANLRIATKSLPYGSGITSTKI